MSVSSKSLMKKFAIPGLKGLQMGNLQLVCRNHTETHKKYFVMRQWPNMRLITEEDMRMWGKKYIVLIK